MIEKRILFVSYTAVLGGGELCLLDFAHAYRDSSEVVLLTDGVLKTRLEELGVKVEVLPSSRSLADVKVSSGLASWKSIGDLWRLGRQIAQKSQDFDLIHANNQKGFVVSAIARLFGGAPVVWHLHDILTANIFSPTNRKIAVTLANWFASRVIVNSQATGDAFIACGGKRQLLRTVYNGFDCAKFDRINDRQATLREELGIPRDRPLVGMFSRLSYWKGQHILLEAVRELPDVHVLLVGDALFGEAEYTEKLKNIAAQPSLKGRVHWLGFRQDIPALMKACDAIAHCSTAPEPFGRVIVEAQLAKRPAIATMGGGTGEIIDDGVTGLLIPPNDPHLLTKAMQKIFSDREFTKAMVEAAYIQAQTKFSIPSVCQAFEMAITGI
ncbi:MULTISPECIES: glycosyltransferase family 4 protein [Pseudanabaena]|uniref:Glycosyl transferase group 1 n=2 Tax=Pseudanabaena TaxID=1152 RepID=L8N8T9_9CYAN|nr:MULTISPECIES: glycosyltransferase family 4 protein [Pseudanabaena]ELS34643.1 glycosyl transferase group 1 [Pseudanabaena biceps PCC 7429]MDG3493166.1 glycosyltransferase family 4 protein [Pseudanabaena catenata USMAC16]